MKALQQERIRYLRNSAEHCRVLARGAVPLRVVQEIEAFAEALDADAQKLEERRYCPAGKARCWGKRRMVVCDVALVGNIASYLRCDERGSVAIIIGLTMSDPWLRGAGTEVTFILLKHRGMRLAADAGAGRATALGTDSPARFSNLILSVSAAGNFQNGLDGTTVTVNDPPLRGTYAGISSAVGVIVDQRRP